ncbi:MAG TPA: A/G-specific adenine glycosylase [Proteiniclasticum sp.]|nr:A/G-specific adenine glycosylase [Proteiniclasticum sp.]
MATENSRQQKRLIDHKMDFAGKILSWYHKNRRTMPWREDPVPYHIWLSEIMLQQTRVDTAMPYFHRFIEKYPDIQALAQSDEEELLKYWEGLGYYNRVRNLRITAISLVENHEGKLPKTYQELLKLKGIGEYTAGAIASEAFGEKVSAVDGNVFRVMARLLGVREDIKEKVVMDLLKDTVKNVLPEEETGNFNQGLIEVGALICIPNGSPKCGLCPVKDYCMAYEKELQDEIPRKKKPKEKKVEERTVLLLEYNGRYAIRRRPEGKLLGGLYEFPHEEGFYEKNEVEALLKEMNLQPVSIGSLKDKKFLFTHIEWRLKAYHIKVEKPNEELLFETRESIKEKYTLATAFRDYLERLDEAYQQSFL